MIHLLIIDALNLIRRIHAVQGSPCGDACLSAVAQLISHTSPTHIVAVFDEEGRHNSWRHEKLPDYKAGRQPMPENLYAELPSLVKQFDAKGVHCWQSSGDEADDLAATLAKKIADAGQTVTIVSTDKGYCQLLSPSIRIRDYFQKRWLDVPFIEKEFGVKPCQLPDYWGLAGISSSKVPGVAGIGAKSATQLLQQYHSIENLFAHLDSVDEKWRKKLIGQFDIAKVCRDIATLRTDIQLQGNLNQLRYHPKP
ncbi:flap endonuclease Xni [Providencia stuartii]|uniref:Flap endonuclease Xni n=1 Tax=Providencia stuartii (strain MRSN 2154) TaxID=1157951 RepID=A0A140NQ64_PROSM|nr:MULTISPECIES: flap endonuclease Xni [Providencia]AFH94817.1 flap endonuclease-like protein [Providencia stuartii MRSN 2154]MDE8748366.1 flap endonuclease Xni [Providencia thailandensis]MDE8767658.1 flap endonuclease Xni [Providencia thailandensis]MDE8780104.1 flap endonuclease Xni [Providencia thailandensis]MDE8783991.1 flap endonuclease Xni [Providencia thailandensis]